MIEKYDDLYKDMQSIQQISVIPNMLDAICRMTGLGFAAVARVTNDRWLACSVLDQVNFGLAEGGELKIETTICNEIRDSRNAVIIDHVSQDDLYKDHHTPKIYGLQSYISFPIILKNGDFFGTLCAIGTVPANLNDPKIITTFEMFADLISFHLQSIDLMERSHTALHESNRRLTIFDSENKQYKKISDHNIKEQVRKIAIFSDILLNNAGETDTEKVKATSVKINSCAKELTKMLDDLFLLSALTADDMAFKKISLNDILKEVCSELRPKLEEKRLTVSYDALPSLSAMPDQMGQLFYKLIDHAADLVKNENAAVFKISIKNALPATFADSLPPGNAVEFCNIMIEFHGEIEKLNLDHAFDIFIHSTNKDSKSYYNPGLAYCQKIVHNHGGYISVESVANGELRFCIILPLNYKVFEEPAVLQMP